MFVALVVGVTFVAFSRVLSAEFLRFDDNQNFLGNPFYRGLGADQLRWMWSGAHGLGHYVPLTWMTLGLDYVLWGMNPAGYHLTNLVLHCASSVLLYLVLLRLLHAGFPAFTGNALRFPAAVGALSFAIHPLRVESVAWITERRDVLSLAFMLASALVYLRFVENRRRGSYVASFALFVAALLSKASVVMLPVALLVLSLYPLRRISLTSTKGWPRIAAELAPFYLASAIGGVVSIIVLPKPVQPAAMDKLVIGAYAAGEYVARSVWPVGLSPLYAMPRPLNPVAPKFIIAYLVLAATLVIALRARSRSPAVTASIVCFGVLLFPFLGAVQNGPHITADRNVYHAGVALAGLLPVALLLWNQRWIRAGAAAILLALGIMTWRQTGFWLDSERLFARVLAMDSTTAVAQVAMGDIRLSQRNYEEARGYYARAVALAPEYAEGYNNIGVIDYRAGRFTEAIAQYQKALAARPQYPEAQLNLGMALSASGNPAGALEHFAAAVAVKPNLPMAHFAWGSALMQLGRPADAIPHLERELTRDPNVAGAGELLDQAQRSARPKK